MNLNKTCLIGVLLLGGALWGLAGVDDRGMPPLRPLRAPGAQIVVTTSDLVPNLFGCDEPTSLG